MTGDSILEKRVGELRRQLFDMVGAASVVTDRRELEMLSSDVYSAGTTAALAIRPTSRETLPKAVRSITAAGFAVIPRGGGMSYTSGYAPVRSDSVIVDTSTLNQIVDISADDMTITVEAGVTWQQIYEALQPLGLRLPCFGTFSGSRATAGGGASNGALFMGTARYGTAAESILGLEVVTADGRVVKTGQAAFANGKSFYRTYGPDLTGLFLHDAGALGIKTLISMRLLAPPAAEDYASFVFTNMDDAAIALSAIARSGAAEEAYILDAVATRSALDSSTLLRDVKRLFGVVKAQGGIVKGLREGAKLIGAGHNFVDKDLCSLHVVCAGNVEESVAADLATLRAIVDRNSGGEVANTMPKAVRAIPFEPVNGILGSKGERWAALNCKVTHSDALEIIARTDAVFEKHAAAMKKRGIWYSRLCIAISNHAFSFEPVLRWHDTWLPLHKSVPEPSYLAKFKEPDANPEACDLVDRIRAEIVDLFADFGAASNQIGKTYHYFESMDTETAGLVRDLKNSLDPERLMNPGALGIPD